MDSQNCFMEFTISESAFQREANNEKFEFFAEIMYEAGISMIRRDETLTFWFSKDTYDRKRKRNAGRKKKLFFNENKKRSIHSLMTGEFVTEVFDTWKYSDVIYMLQTMSNKKIQETINIPKSTYYKHKKAMKESEYYKSLDKSRLHDKEYLESVCGNKMF